MPLDDWPPRVFQHLLPVLIAGLVGLLLVPPEKDLSDGVAAADEIVVADGDVEVDALHVHLVDDKDKGLVPVGVQVARLDRSLLLLADALVLRIKRRLKFSVYFLKHLMHLEFGLYGVPFPFHQCRVQTIS